MRGLHRCVSGENSSGRSVKTSTSAQSSCSTLSISAARASACSRVSCMTRVPLGSLSFCVMAGFDNGVHLNDVFEQQWTRANGFRVAPESERVLRQTGPAELAEALVALKIVVAD